MLFLLLINKKKFLLFFFVEGNDISHMISIFRQHTLGEKIPQVTNETCYIESQILTPKPQDCFFFFLQLVGDLSYDVV